MEKAYATRLAPATIDALILAGLRNAGRPIEAGELPDVCRIRYETLPLERAASLERLASRGLVDRRSVRKPSRTLPLLERVEVTTYSVIGGAL